MSENYVCNVAGAVFNWLDSNELHFFSSWLMEVWVSSLGGCPGLAQRACLKEITLR